MRHVTGRLVLVQEGRFRLMKDGGQVELFLLAPDAPLEPQDLPLLQRRQERVTVHFTEREGLIGGIAHDITAAPPRRSEPAKQEPARSREKTRSREKQGEAAS